jgi:PTS system nitrogen regulatory IIA component
MSFGATLRLLRLDAGISLRDLAARIGVSSAYLSRVEHGHDPAPTPDRLVAIARTLDIPAVTLLELARQTGAAVSGYMARVPAASALFLEIARRDLSGSQIARLKAFLDQEFPQRSRSRRSPARLSQMLPAEHVVVQMSGADIDDVIDVAVSRMALGPRLRPQAVVSRILEREHEAPSTLGGGVAVPHAIVPAAPTTAVLVTLAEPLAMETPDGVPVELVVVLLSREGGRRHLEILAHIARLASQGMAEELSALPSAERILARLEHLETIRPG